MVNGRVTSAIISSAAAVLIIGGASSAGDQSTNVPVDPATSSPPVAAPVDPATSSPPAAEPAEDVGTGPVPLSDAAMAQGQVAADTTATLAARQPELERVQTADGAVAAFISYTTWLLGSKAAAAEPTLAMDAVTDAAFPSLNREQVRLALSVGRATLDPTNGGYRVLGFSGPPEQPDQVMVEALGHLTSAKSSRWMIYGGTVIWSKGGWRLGGFLPNPQAEAELGSAAQRNTSSAKAATAPTPPGLGWTRFQDAPTQ